LALKGVAFLGGNSRNHGQVAHHQQFASFLESHSLSPKITLSSPEGGHIRGHTKTASTGAASGAVSMRATSISVSEPAGVRPLFQRARRVSQTVTAKQLLSPHPETSTVDEMAITQ
jgi:hypothetical protein